LTADTAATFMADTTRLSLLENEAGGYWDASAATCETMLKSLRKLSDRAHGKDVLDRVSVQISCYEMHETMQQLYNDMRQLMDYYAGVTQAQKPLINMAVDILLHRPSQMALLEPGQSHMVPITTPTLGTAGVPSGADDAHRLITTMHKYGLQMSSV
jgi:hypothetical protein